MSEKSVVTASGIIDAQEHMIISCSGYVDHTQPNEIIYISSVMTHKCPNCNGYPKAGPRWKVVKKGLIWKCRKCGYVKYL